MKILQLSANADRVGGAEIYMHALTEELRARGHEVATFGTCPETETDSPHERVVRRDRYVASALATDVDVESALRALLDRFAPDVIHVHNLYGLPLSVDGILADAAAPVVQTVHDYSTVCPNSWCVRGDGSVCSGGAGAKCFLHGCTENYPYDARMVLVAATRAAFLRTGIDAMLCPSEFLTETMRRNGFAQAVTVPNFVDADKLAIPDVAREPARLLYLGRLDKTKGVSYLLQALPTIVAAHPDTVLGIVGSGPEADALHAEHEALGLQGRVEFLGKVPYEQVMTFYATATLLVLPSIWCENSPLTCYEAMVAGLPIVGSNIGGIPDLVKDNATGRLVAPRDPAALAGAIVDLLGAPRKRSKMSRKARARVRRYTRRRNVDAVEKTYKRVRAGRAARATPSIAFDADQRAIVDGVLRQIAHLEQWAQDLKGHADYVENENRALVERVETLEAHAPPPEEQP